MTMRALTDLARGCSEGPTSPQLEALILAGLTDAICTCIPRLDYLVPSTFGEKRQVCIFVSHRSSLLRIKPILSGVIRRTARLSYY